MEGVEWTKIKYMHSRDTLRNPLNIHLYIKIGTVFARGVLVGEG
jgi:hypothetical protein